MAQAGRTFRIFISSTFSDLKEERNALQERVFPKLRELCMQYGCRFQAIDLRWGVSEEAFLDQQAMNICLGEIARCRNTSPRPNFIVLLGDRYGARPLPPQIEAQEFEAILDKVSEPDKQLLFWSDVQPEERKGWYRRDDNAVPPEYGLRPRKIDIPEGASEEEQKAAYDRQGQEWRQTEQRLRSILLGAIVQLGWGQDDPRRTKYDASATEQEIVQGALNVADAPDHVFGFFRTIEGMPEDPSASDFLDLDEGGAPDREARTRLEHLKNTLRRLLPGNIFECRARWIGAGMSLDHLPALCDAVFTNLSRVIGEEIALLEAVDSLDKESANHESFGAERARFFTGRVGILRTIGDYLRRHDRHPLVVFGSSGAGKSAVLARAMQQAREDLPDAHIVIRFIGATPGSSDGRALLESLCHQISRLYGADAATIPTDYRELAQELPKWLALAAAQRPLFIFLDALDQLSDLDPARNLNWLPIDLPDYVHLIVSTLPGERWSMLKRRLSSSSLIELEPMPSEEGGALLARWLADAGRTLQAPQRAEVLGKFERNGLPLYLKLAYEEARRWKSYARPLQMVLSPDIAGVIRDLFARLSKDVNHGAMMVQRSLGYLAAAKNGLSEDELLDVLSRDEDVLAAFKARAKHTPPEDRLPVVIWSRLYFDLESYLTERNADSTSLMAFYHRQLREAVMADYLSGTEKVARHRVLAGYFGKQVTEFRRDDQTTPNVRKLSELPYQQTLGELWDDLFATLTDFRFLERKVEANAGLERGPAPAAVGVVRLLDDFDLALRVWPRQQQDADSIRSLQLPLECLGQLRLLARLVRREGHVLARQPEILSSHLYMMLYLGGGDDTLVRPLLARARRALAARSWLRLVNYPDIGATGEPLVHVLEHGSGVNAVAWSPDGRWIASAGGDQAVVIWSSTTGERQFTLKGHTAQVTALAWSPDGHRLASGSDDHTVCLWETATWTRTRVLEGRDSPGSVSALLWSSNGERLASFGGIVDRDVRSWNPVTGGAHAVLVAGPPTVAWSRNLALVAARAPGEQNVVQIWDGGDGSLRAQLPESSDPLAWSPDGGTLAMRGARGRIVLWDAGTGGTRAIEAPHTDRVTALAWSPDGVLIASASADGTIRIWDRDGKRRAACVGHWDDEPQQGPGNNFASRVNPNTGRWVSRRLPADVIGLAWSPDGSLLASVGKDKTVRLWARASGVARGVLRGPTDATVAWSPDATTLAVHDRDTSIWFWRTAEPDRASVLGGHTGSVYAVAWAPDGRSLASGGGDGTVRIWDPDVVVEDRGIGGGAIKWLGRSTDSGLLATAGGGNTIRLWKPLTGCPAGALMEQFASVRTMVWSPDGTRAAAIDSSAYSVRLWDVLLREPRHVLTGHTDVVLAVAWSPDGRLVATGGADHTVRVWKTANGALLSVLQGHSGAVRTLAWASGGRFLASAGDDHTIRVWLRRRRRWIAIHTLEQFGDKVDHLAWSPDSAQLAASGEMVGCVWDLQNGECRVVLPGADEPLVWSADGKALASRLYFDAVAVWDVHTGEPAVIVAGQRCALSPNGRLLAAVCRDGSVRVWEVATGACVGMARPLSRVRDIRFSQDGARLHVTDDGRATGHRPIPYVFELVNARLSPPEPIPSPATKPTEARADAAGPDAGNEVSPRLTPAGPLCEALSSLLARAIGTHDKQFALTLMALGATYVTHGLCAEMVYRHLLGVLREQPEADSRTLAVCLHQLANMVVLQDRFAEAELLYHEAIAILEGPGTKYEDLVGALRDCAYLYEQLMHDDAKAEALYRRTLEVLMVALGPDDTRVAATWRELGMACTRHEKYEEAEHCLRRAVAILEARGPNEHASLRDVLGDLARIVGAQGKIAEQEALIAQAGAPMHAEGEPAASGTTPAAKPASFDTARLTQILQESPNLDEARKRLKALGIFMAGPLQRDDKEYVLVRFTGDAGSTMAVMEYAPHDIAQQTAKDAGDQEEAADLSDEEMVASYWLDTGHTAAWQRRFAREEDRIALLIRLFRLGAGAGAVPSTRARARRCSSTARVCLHNSVRFLASPHVHSGASV